MLTKEQTNIIIESFRPYRPERIGVFGSVSRSKNNSQSDLDILYNFNEPISLFQKFDLKEELEKKLGVVIDLVSEKNLHPLLAQNIMNDLRIIYDRTKQR